MQSETSVNPVFLSACLSLCLCVFPCLPVCVSLSVCLSVCVCYSLSESFFMVKGAALFLQQGTNAQGPKTPTHHKLAGNYKQSWHTLSPLFSEL